MYRQWAAELGNDLGVPDDAGVLGVPVVQAADVGLNHADSCLGRGYGLHQAACAGAGPSAKQLFLLQENAFPAFAAEIYVRTCSASSMTHPGLGGMQPGSRRSRRDHQKKQDPHL